MNLTLDYSDMSLCSEGAETDGLSSLDSTLYQSMMTANLRENQTLQRQASSDSSGDGPSLSFLPSLASPLRFLEHQNSLDAQINRMRRSITVSSHLSRKGKEPVRDESHQFRTEASSNSSK